MHLQTWTTYFNVLLFWSNQENNFAQLFSWVIFICIENKSSMKVIFLATIFDQIVYWFDQWEWVIYIASTCLASNWREKVSQLKPGCLPIRAKFLRCTYWMTTTSNKCQVKTSVSAIIKDIKKHKQLYVANSSLVLPTFPFLSFSGMKRGDEMFGYRLWEEHESNMCRTIWVYWSSIEVNGLLSTTMFDWEWNTASMIMPCLHNFILVPSMQLSFTVTRSEMKR